MSFPTNRYVIAVALSYGATIELYEAELSGEQASCLERLLAGLAELGHVAAYTIDQARPHMDEAAVIEALRLRWDFVVDAVLGAEHARGEPRPAFLIPVFEFDHELSGRPASTARFLSLDLELIATPSPDEELGVRLPGRQGQWIVHARPLLF